jgi:hypothetical protein
MALICLSLQQKYLHRTVGNGKRETSLWSDYLRQALRDTLTLFLHGICCDIDVEAGPCQLASRHIRKRLELLKTAFPPPEGYALFPSKSVAAGRSVLSSIRVHSCSFMAHFRLARPGLAKL